MTSRKQLVPVATMRPAAISGNYFVWIIKYYAELFAEHENVTVFVIWPDVTK